MPNSCTICQRPDRAEIENAILSLTSRDIETGSATIEDIAEQYGVDLDDLKMHALFHTPLISDADISRIQGGAPSATATEPATDSTPQPISIMRKLKLREVDMLNEVGQEYLVTLKAMGRRINRLAQTSSIDEEDRDKEVKLAKLLTKPMVDLYVGLGGEIRQTVKTMAEIDRMLNGPEDSAAAGMAALAAAIRGSAGGDDQ